MREFQKFSRACFVRRVAVRGWPAISLLTLVSVLICILAVLAAPVPAQAAESDFKTFVEGVWPDARSRGVSRETFDQAFASVRYDPSVVAHTHAQPEFSKPIWQYLSAAVSPTRIAAARAKARDFESWLAKAQGTYGVDKAVILGIWGLETDFGGFVGTTNVIQALSSLAFVNFRGDYFRGELIEALVILDDGDVSPREMRGSWAGAMGQTQFMPSSFSAYAVDFDGDGRRDIWTSAPDAIGSTANYLKKHGWKAGQPWGVEVVLPKKFAISLSDSTVFTSFSKWADRGVRRADGGSLPANGDALLSVPAGLKGPAFLLTHNFEVIKTYNNSTSYAFAVAMLGDRAYGGAPVAGRWPVHDRQLSESQVRVLQSRLRKLGYDVGEVDGHIGETVRSAFRKWQNERGLPPDGYVTASSSRQLGK